VHIEYHVACLVGDDCVVMGGHIVKNIVSWSLFLWWIWLVLMQVS
jgi:hypothetical protein